MKAAGKARQHGKPFPQTQQLTRPVPAPLQTAAPVVQQHIAGYLTYAEAIRFMLASRSLRVAISAAPRSRLQEFSHSLRALMREQALATTPHGPTSPGFWKKNALRLKDAAGTLRKKKPTPPGLEFESHKDQLQAEVENVVFHFAADRPGDPGEPGADYSELHDAIERGDVALVRAGLREFLSLPPRLISTDQKMVWVREAKGRCSLRYFSQYRCGDLLEQEQRQCESIGAYVDEVVSSQSLDETQKSALCVCLELLTFGDDGSKTPTALPPGAHAMVHNNPAVAASILIGIHESAADWRLKFSLLAGTVRSWRAHAMALTSAARASRQPPPTAPEDIARMQRVAKILELDSVAQCVDMVAASLEQHAPKAPDWVDGLIQRLANIKTTFGARAYTQV